MASVYLRLLLLCSRQEGAGAHIYHVDTREVAAPGVFGNTPQMMLIFSGSRKRTHDRRATKSTIYFQSERISALQSALFWGNIASIVRFEKVPSVTKQRVKYKYGRLTAVSKMAITRFTAASDRTRCLSPATYSSVTRPLLLRGKFLTSRDSFLKV